MNSPEKSIFRIWPFFIPFGIFWIVSMYWWMTMGYYGTFKFLNQFHHPYSDSLSLYVFTHFGDGLILPGLFVLFFWKKNPALATTAIIAMLLTGLLAQIGKMAIFPDWYRPPKIFEGSGELIVHPHPPRNHSFPSGHATSIAAGGVFFAWFFSEWKKWSTVVVGIFSVLLCFTRVVLGVHFPGDIFIGSLIGSAGAMLIIRFVLPFVELKMNKATFFHSRGSFYVALGLALIVIIVQYLNLYFRLQ